MSKESESKPELKSVAGSGSESRERIALMEKVVFEYMNKVMREKEKQKQKQQQQ